MKGALRVTTGRVPVPAELKPLLEQVGGLAERKGIAAYAVGGCVRDWSLGDARVTDLDLVVEGDGVAFARVVGDALRASVISHEQFGTATIERPSGRQAAPLLRIDVASCRKETYAEPAAYPNVSAGTLRDDLFRRDFTINAMATAISPARFGRLIDPFGGLADLRARRLRILHPKSFLDDPSRILRGARFVERYRLSVEPRTLRRLREAVAAGMLGRLNRGRVRKELERMAGEPDPLACLIRLGHWLQS